ncbi:MAG: hypothetical protein IT371_30335 [Deltaproteobacteria bacterium]|nr:hypothetical protein [Deltaproteobacteria bacterium]
MSRNMQFPPTSPPWAASPTDWATVTIRSAEVKAARDGRSLFAHLVLDDGSGNEALDVRFVLTDASTYRPSLSLASLAKAYCGEALQSAADVDDFVGCFSDLPGTVVKVRRRCVTGRGGHVFDFWEFAPEDPEDEPADGGTWTTRDGRKLAIRDMTDSHLGNTLRYLTRNGSQGIPAFALMEREAARRGLHWIVPEGMTCRFDVDGVRCGAPAVMLTPPKAGRQEGRCERHRQDALTFAGRACDGCLKVVDLVVEVPTLPHGDGERRSLLFCGACVKEPEGAFHASLLGVFLSTLLMFLTLGLYRPRSV